MTILHLGTSNKIKHSKFAFLRLALSLNITQYDSLHLHPYFPADSVSFPFLLRKKPLSTILYGTFFFIPWPLVDDLGWLHNIDIENSSLINTNVEVPL